MRSTRGTFALVAALALLVGVVAPVASAGAATSRASVVDWTQVPGANANDLIVNPYSSYLGRALGPGFSYTGRASGIADFCAATDATGAYPCPFSDFHNYFTLNSTSVNGLGATINVTVTNTHNTNSNFIAFMSDSRDTWQQVFSASSHGWLNFAELIGGQQVGQSSTNEVFCYLGVPCSVSFSMTDDYGGFIGNQWLATSLNVASQIFIPLNPVTGPTAAFTSTASSSSDPGQRQFVSSSSSPSGDALISAWDFGDGSTSTAGSVTHSFTKPGTYHVKLTVTDPGGLSNSVTHDVVIAAPRLTVTPTVNGTADVAPGDPVGVDVLVSASSDGVGNLSGVHWDAASPAGLASAPADAIADLSSPSPALPDTLAPGQSTTLHFTATAGTHLTTAALSSAVDAMDAAGTAVTASGSANLKIATHALTVSITPATNPVQLAFDTSGTPIPQDVAVNVVVTNRTQDSVDGVTVAPLDLAAADPSHPYSTFPARVLDPNLAVDLGTLAGGASVTVTRTVHVTDYADLTMSDLVTSVGDTVLGTAAFSAGLPSLGLTWQMDDRWDGTVNTIITSPEQLAPASWGFTVIVSSGCGDSNVADISLTIDGAVPQSLVRDDSLCSFHFTRPDLSPFTAVATLTRSTKTVATGSVDIQGRDFVIAAVGDSLSSGEGLPASTWSLAQCDRSVVSGSGLAATRLELADRHSAVDYVSLACSGATTDEGLLGPYVGIQPGAPLPAQLNELARYAAVRSIDSVIFSIGANDVQFGDVVKACLVSPIGCDGSTYLPLTLTPIGPFLAGKFGELRANYAAVNQYLRAAGVDPSHVVTLTYPDSTHSDEAGNPYCNADLSSLVGGSRYVLTPQSWEYMHDAILLPLNRAVVSAASVYGWKAVTGAEQAFLNHGYCSSDPWITTITSSLQTEYALNGGFHPNEPGYVWYGNAIYDALSPVLLPGGEPIPARPTAPQPVVATGTISAGTAEAGSQETVSGAGFAIGEPVTVTLHSEPVLLTTVTADGFGNLGATVTIPAATIAGSHELILVGQVTGNTISIPLTVTVAIAPAAVSSAKLAMTGTDPTGELLAATLLVMLGLAVRFIRRRRARPVH